MRRMHLLGLAVVFGCVMWSFGVAVCQELPVVVPQDLPVLTIPPLIPVTFDDFHNAVATTGGTGLHLDLGDPTLQGTFHFGIFPFGEGDADLAYTRFRYTGSVVDGKCDLDVSAYLSGGTNVNGWPDGRGLYPPR